MEEKGVEKVDTYRTWVYFRKKAVDGDFQIYSDLDSRIKHYKRVSNVWFAIGCAELCIGFSQITLLVTFLEIGSRYFIVHAAAMVLFFSTAIILFGLRWRYTKKIKLLRHKHTRIRETLRNIAN